MLSRGRRESDGSASEVFLVLYFLVMCEILTIQFKGSRSYLQVDSLLPLLWLHYCHRGRIALSTVTLLLCWLFSRVTKRIIKRTSSVTCISVVIDNLPSNKHSSDLLEIRVKQNWFFFSFFSFRLGKKIHMVENSINFSVKFPLGMMGIYWITWLLV